VFCWMFRLVIRLFIVSMVVLRLSMLVRSILFFLCVMFLWLLRSKFEC